MYMQHDEVCLFASFFWGVGLVVIVHLLLLFLIVHGRGSNAVCVYIVMCTACQH